MAAAAIATVATLSFSSVHCKNRLRQHGANNAPQSHGHHSLTLSPRPRVPRPRSATSRLTVVAQAAGTGTGYKVAILGAAGEVGQPLALLAKMSPLISSLHLYDASDTDVAGVAADLSHCNTPAQVSGFTGTDSLAACLSGAHVVVIAAGAVTTDNHDDDELQFGANAGVVSELAAAVAEHAPAGALVHVLTAPVSATVPVVAEVLKRWNGGGAHEYDPRRLLGVTTLGVVRANALVAARKALPLADVDVPVVGGGGGAGGLPLLSKARPRAAFTEEEAEELTARVRVVEPAPMSMAYAAARFLEATLRGLEGHDDVYECAYVQSSQVAPELPFFACRVKLGRGGVEEVVGGAELRGVTEYEARELEALKPRLRASIDRGVAFVQQQNQAALN